MRARHQPPLNVNISHLMSRNSIGLREEGDAWGASFSPLQVSNPCFPSPWSTSLGKAQRERETYGKVSPHPFLGQPSLPPPPFPATMQNRNGWSEPPLGGGWVGSTEEGPWAVDPLSTVHWPGATQNSWLLPLHPPRAGHLLWLLCAGSCVCTVPSSSPGYPCPSGHSLLGLCARMC